MATKRKVIRSEGRAIIASVYHFLKEEFEFTKLTKEPNWDISHLQNISRRTAEATGVSLKTVSKILKEEKEMKESQDASSSFVSPMKNRRKRENKTEIDNVNADVIRSTIHNFYTVRKEIPTLAKLRSVLNENIGFDGCLQTLRKLLFKLGYKWRKTEGGRKVLSERHDVQMWRLKFLKEIRKFRSQGRTIVYTGERYIPANKKGRSAHTHFLLWHAGTKDGFIEKSALLHNSNMGVYAQMSDTNFVLWLDEKLLPNIPKRSVIVLDNAPHHNTLTQKLPTPASTKEDMKKWLRSNGIAFDNSLLKIELYDLIKKNKEEHKVYQIDDYINSEGFDVIRLPPFHPELNAIENIWGILKNHIASNSTTDTERLIHEGLNEIKNETWRKTCDHVEKIEKEYLKYLDTDIEFTVDFQNDSDDSGTEYDCSSDDE